MNMSIFTVSARLNQNNIKHVVVAADNDKYIESWLKLLGTTSFLTEEVQRMHWNMRGKHFMSLHASYFQPLYEYLFDLQDKFAEKSKYLDHLRDIDSKVFTSYNTIGETVEQYVSSGFAKFDRVHGYIAYAVYTLSKLKELMRIVNITAVKREDLGGQNLIAGQTETLDAWLWKARAMLPEKRK
jgi:DNA-binding ferritin-like protein